MQFEAFSATGRRDEWAQVTVTVQVAVFVPAFAVMIASPAETAVTLPVAESTVATSDLLVDQTTVSVESDGVTVAVRLVSLLPAVKVNALLLRVMPVAGFGAAATVTAELLGS